MIKTIAQHWTTVAEKYLTHENIAYALSEGCSIQIVNVGYSRDITLRYKGCHYVFYREEDTVEEGVRQLKALWFPWLRRLSSWTRYINVEWGPGEM